ncbi:putative amidohydrolase [Sulfurospirillum barnesii SES-3]|uniref:Putative amidohydrolase n=2 Tax=Sulfurospirillum barnesii TaxID=44674 RepID=I3XTX1_SULBS|nr:putative amidohydrolase [Sulfurospirillum barnesii SES-3]
MMTSNPMLCALQFAYEKHSFDENFQTLKHLVAQTPHKSIVLAPELCLSAYPYERMEEAAQFSERTLPELAKLSTCKTLALTLIEKTQLGYLNNFKLFHDGKLIYTQAKTKLFPLGKEEHHFRAGVPDNIGIVELNGIKIAVLICFELRFTNLWEQIKGADLILIPAYWGKERKMHFEVLTRALAIANQAFVLCANSADETMAKSSAIISAFGHVTSDDAQSLIMYPFDRFEIKKMRRYLDVGINHNVSIDSL